jgi:hypothetical protein
MSEDEWIVDWEDGSYWALSWVQDAGAFFAQRWFPDEEHDLPYLDCPGPDVGLFESVETVEAAMGGAIPAEVRAKLLRYSEAYPITQDALDSWGVSIAYEIERLAPGGEIISTFAPPGTENPFAARWLPEWM